MYFDIFLKIDLDMFSHIIKGESLLLMWLNKVDLEIFF